MLALYDLTRDSLGENGGLRAAFYLVIFPTGFFLDNTFYSWASAWYEMACGFFTGADINRCGMFVNSQRSACCFTEFSVERHRRAAA